MHTLILRFFRITQDNQNKYLKTKGRIFKTKWRSMFVSFHISKGILVRNFFSMKG